jgi:hypothetical protein
MNKPPPLHIRDRPNMTQLTFDELRETMAMTNEGQVLDSFIAVEMGQDNYQACWDAHTDIYEQSGVNADEETIVTLFLQEMYDMLDIEEDDFVKVLGASL